ncbi:ankyrin repeat-containing domain protein [Terfezia claveryi]|nr:ankyrin repeat-containing domain protein [Terfezia claveryi]
MCSRRVNSHKICKLLVDKGAAIDTPDSAGRTPLSYAVANGSHWDNFKLLVDKGAELDRSDSSDRTPLSYAAATPRKTTIKIAKFLVDHGAVVDTRDSSGRTPLSYAASSRGWAALDISKMLMGAGAAVDTPDLCGRTPLSYAAATGADVPRELILAFVDREWGRNLRGRPPARDIYIFKDTRIALCTLLLDKGAKVDTIDSAGHSPYWYARDANNNEICQFLAKRGAKQDI